MLKRINNSSGFSLLEVLISIGILACGVVMVLEALSFSARACVFSVDTLKAVFLAEDKMQELGFKEKESLVEVTEVSDKIDKFQWRYSTRIGPLLSREDLTVFKLNLGVTWKLKDREKEIELNTYLVKFK